jgi:xylan 1,4-beta-xylosidase
MLCELPLPLASCDAYVRWVRPAPPDSRIERIEHQENLPLRLFVHSVRSCASHHHRECEFLLGLQGEVIVYTATGETTLGPDDLFFIPAHELHLTRGVTAANLVATLQVDPALAVRLDPEFPRRRFVFNELARRQRDDARLQAVRALLAEIFWEMRLRRSGYRLMVEAHVLRLLGLLVREVPSELEPAGRTVAGGETHEALGLRLERIVAFVETHCREELSSLDLARAEGVSVSYLARLFKERLGTTFGDYVNQVRARQSLPQLAHGDVTVLELALACGFPSVKSYNQVFKRLYGIPPTEWRRRRMGAPVPGLGESAYNVANTGLAYHLLKRHLPAESPLCA